MEATLTEQVQAQTPAMSVKTGKDIDVSFKLLFPGNNNMRTVMAAGFDEGIIELAALIHSQGLLHRLSVTNEGEEGYGVQAGGRRFKALSYNVHIGRLSEEAMIPCTEYDQERGTAISIAENSGREESHPVDQFMAFAKLRDQGATDGQIASEYGVSLLTVQRRMVLSKIAPRFHALCREGKATLDQLQALAMTSSHEQQNAAWDSLHESSRTPYLLRRQLTNAEVEGTDPFALLVGIEAYQEAGGTVRHDLFSSDDEHFFSDSVLLRQLAMDKLNAAAAAEREAGWAWVEVATDLSDSCYYKCDREHPATTKPTDAEAEGLEVLADLIEGIDRYMEGLGEGEDVSDAEFEAWDAHRTEVEVQQDNLYELRKELQALLTSWRPQTLKTCGAIVTLKRDGTIDVKRGLLRPEDKKAMEKAKVEKLRKAGKPIPGHLKASAPAERGAFSESLMLDMTSHQTAAMQATLLGQPHVALALAVYTLAEKFFSAGYFHSTSPLRLSAALTRSTQLSTCATEYAASPAAAVLEQAENIWAERLPGGDGQATTLPWFLKQEDSVLLDLLAFLMASSLDAMHRRERQEWGTDDALIDALNLDMADWWTATPEKFLSRVSKAQLIEAVTEACSAEEAKAMETMKKGEAVTFASAKLADTRWLPAPLRRKPNPQ